MPSKLIETSFNTTLTTKGDILVHNGTTSARLATGTNGYAFHSAPGQSIKVEWASATTQGSSTHERIATSTLTATSTSVVFSSIPDAYAQFTLIVSARNTAAVRAISVSLNTDATTANAEYYAYESGGSFLRAVNTATGSPFSILHGQCESDSPTDARGVAEVTINQTLSRDLMAIKYRGHILRLTSGSSPASYHIGVSEGFGVASSVTVPVTRIGITTSGAFAIGSVFTLYGVRR